LNRPIAGFAPDALEALLRYRWPGNIRELEHAIERACALAQGNHIELADLSEVVRGETHAVAPSVNRTLQEIVRDYQCAYLLDAIMRHHGNRERTAQALGISLSTLKRRLRVARAKDSARPSAEAPVTGEKYQDDESTALQWSC
jgi:DNA-binding NtrC family response regulator